MGVGPTCLLELLSRAAHNMLRLAHITAAAGDSECNSSSRSIKCGACQERVSGEYPVHHRRSAGVEVIEPQGHVQCHPRPQPPPGHGARVLPQDAVQVAAWQEGMGDCVLDTKRCWFQ